MKKIAILSVAVVFVCVIIALVIMGGNKANSDSSPISSSTTKAILKTNVSNLSKEEVALVVGTYVGEDGSVLIFHDDGKVDYFFKTWDSIEKDNPWMFRDSKITWNLSSLNCDIYASVDNNESKVLNFKSDSDNWSNEFYEKVYDEAKEYSVEECKKLIEAKMPGTIKTETTDNFSGKPTGEEVIVTVVGKKNQEADIYKGRYSARVNFVIEVENKTDRAIQGVEGVLTVSDLFGKEIISSRCDFTGKTINAGETVIFDEKGLDINEFIDSHTKLYNENFDDLNFSYKVNTIVYAGVDGKESSLKSKTTGSTEVEVVCTGKSNISADINKGRYLPHAQFTFEVQNKTDKNIKGVQGVLTVSDLFGKEITKFNCDFTGSIIPANGSTIFTDKYLEINEFIDEDVKIYNEKYEDMQFSYKVTDIVYA